VNPSGTSRTSATTSPGGILARTGVDPGVLLLLGGVLLVSGVLVFRYADE
jgi:hypothetical protein